MAGMVASKFSEQGTGGWAWILSDLKSLLETGARCNRCACGWVVDPTIPVRSQLSLRT